MTNAGKTKNIRVDWELVPLIERLKELHRQGKTQAAQEAGAQMASLLMTLIGPTTPTGAAVLPAHENDAA